MTIRARVFIGGRRAFPRTVPVTQRHTSDRQHLEADPSMPQLDRLGAERAICGVSGRQAFPRKRAGRDGGGHSDRGGSTPSAA